jgi:hypothetical protein
MSSAITALENQIRAETEAARAAIRVALAHAHNVGKAYSAVRDILSQSQVQAWLAGPTHPDRHVIMTCRRISMCDLNTNARTLADLMLDRAAEHIAQGAQARSRSEMIEANRAKLQGGSNLAAGEPSARIGER